MSIPFIILVCGLLISLCRTNDYGIENHVTADYNEGLLSLHSSAESFIESTWILLVNPANGKRISDPHMDTLKECITKDQCILLYSRRKETSLLFKVYCHHTFVNDNVTDITVDTILPYTLSHYLYHYFDKADVQTEKNKLIRRPHFFYGNDHMLEYAARMDANRGNTMNGEGETIMMPSNNALDRIKALNYIETNVGWDLDRIDQHAGMLDQRYQYILYAPDVDIYVIDTGIRVTHSEFEGRATFLVNTVGDNIDTDMAGHGTFCASEVAGKPLVSQRRLTSMQSRCLTLLVMVIYSLSRRVFFTSLRLHDSIVHEGQWPPSHWEVPNHHSLRMQLPHLQRIILLLPSLLETRVPIHVSIRLPRSVVSPLPMY